jgi:long-subunit fatty acid transport protein
MKRFIILVLFIGTSAFSQDITDALRFSSHEINGTARYTAMGGAFGALGGDISAININPASSAVFLNNKFSGSLDLTSVNNDAFYGGNSNTTSSSNFDLNQLGAVFVFEANNQDALFKKLTLGFSYNRTNNYDNEYFVNGDNVETIADYFINRAEGTALNTFDQGLSNPIGAYRDFGRRENFAAQQGFIGYNTFIIDAANPDNPNNTTYVSNVFGASFNQNYSETTRGSSGKYTINGGGMIGDRLHLGLNLNFHFSEYRRETLFDEFNSGTGVNEIFFDNDLRIRGSGFSFQLGGIAKITEEWRLGFTYDSPTWMSISEELIQRLETVRAGGNTPAIIDPDILNIYPDYNFKTPGRLSLSTAYVFGGSGLISFDYSYKDFSAMEFTSSGFGFQNDEISNLMTGASTFNLGGEYRIQNTSLRAGYFIQESPYLDENFLGDTTGYSFGLGFNFGNAILDFSYQRVEQDRQGILYFTDITQESDIQSFMNNYMVTLTLNL